MFGLDNYLVLIISVIDLLGCMVFTWTHELENISEEVLWIWGGFFFGGMVGIVTSVLNIALGL